MKSIIATAFAWGLAVASATAGAAESLESKLENSAKHWQSEAKEKVEEAKKWEKRERGEVEKRAEESKGKAEDAAKQEAARASK